MKDRTITVNREWLRLALLLDIGVEPTEEEIRELITIKKEDNMVIDSYLLSFNIAYKNGIEINPDGTIVTDFGTEYLGSYTNRILDQFGRYLNKNIYKVING